MDQNTQNSQNIQHTRNNRNMAQGRYSNQGPARLPAMDDENEYENQPRSISSAGGHAQHHSGGPRPIFSRGMHQQQQPRSMPQWPVSNNDPFSTNNPLAHQDSMDSDNSSAHAYSFHQGNGLNQYGGRHGNYNHAQRSGRHQQEGYNGQFDFPRGDMNAGSFNGNMNRGHFNGNGPESFDSNYNNGPSPYLAQYNQAQGSLFNQADSPHSDGPPPSYPSRRGNDNTSFGEGGSDSQNSYHEPLPKYEGEAESDSEYHDEAAVDGEDQEDENGGSEFDESEDNGDGASDDEDDQDAPDENTWKVAVAPENMGPHVLSLTSEEAYKTEKAARRKSQTEHKEESVQVNAAEKAYWVQEICNAIKNTMNILDQPANATATKKENDGNGKGKEKKKEKERKPAQAVTRIIHGYYPKRDIEIAAWDIVTECIASCKGHKLCEDHHKTKWEDDEQHCGFKGRITAIREALTKSKAVCKQILDPPYIHRLVDAPNTELTMKMANKRLNANRDVQNRLGRTVINGGKEALTPEQLAEAALKTPQKNKGRAAPGTAVKEPAEKFSYIKFERAEPITQAKPKAKAKATPSASAKKRNKQPSRARANNVKVEDEDSDSEGDYESPSKRRATGMGSASKSANRGNSHHKTPTKQRSTRSAVANRKKLVIPSSDGEEEDAQNDLKAKEDKYKMHICDLLEVDHEFADDHSLIDLRIYGRAYNTDFNETLWELPETTDFVGKCTNIHPSVVRDKQLVVDGPGVHFLQYFAPKFDRLAVARGDMNEDGTLNDESKPCSSAGIADADEALGYLQNDFGYFGIVLKED